MFWFIYSNHLKSTDALNQTIKQPHKDRGNYTTTGLTKFTQININVYEQKMYEYMCLVLYWLEIKKRFLCMLITSECLGHLYNLIPYIYDTLTERET